jgi:hypothetical protein
VSDDRRVVLDASALRAWVMRERGAGTIDVLLPHALVPVSALVETLYRARERGHGLATADLHHAPLPMGIAVAQCVGLTVTGGDQFWETLDLAVDYRPFR